MSNIFLITLLSVLLTACGGSSPSSTEQPTDPDSSPTTTNYIGPGSVWNVSLSSDATFSITRKDNIDAVVDNTITGTYLSKDSGFIEMKVVSSTTGSPAVDSNIFAINIPDFALVMMINGEDTPIVTVPAGNCPADTFDANAIMVNNTDGEDATNTAGNFYHTIHWDSSTNNLSFPKLFDLVNHLQQADEGTVSTSNCTDGVLKIDSDVVFFTDNGGYIAQIIETGGGDEVIFGIPQKTLADRSNMDGSYYGFRYDSTNARTVEPIVFECATGVCSGTEYDVDTGASSVVDIVMNLSGDADSPSTGYITGTVATGGNSGSVSCMVDANSNNSGNALMACISQAPSDNTKLYSMIMVSK